MISRAILIPALTMITACGTPAISHNIDDYGIVDMAEYSSKQECLAALRDAPAVCDGVRFNGFETIQAARLDINGNGHEDLVVRRFTRSDCGSHGCSTLVYLNRGGALRQVEPKVVAAGVIAQCNNNGARGINLAQRSNGSCLLFK